MSSKLESTVINRFLDLDLIDHNKLAMFIVYDHPKDFADKYVVRMFLVSTKVEASPFITLCDTLEEARATIPYYCSCLQRNPTDDPHIVETWF
jgi:hypothetical protein